MSDEPKRRGRPLKSHLHEDHHYQPANETLDNDSAAVATPAVSDASQADTNEAALADSSMSAVPIHEAVVENPTIALDVDIQKDSATNISGGSAYSQQSLPDAENVDIIGNSHVRKESPIEEKIHVLVEQQRVFLGEPQTVEVSGDINGWHPLHTEIVLQMPPRNGMPIRLSETTQGEGVLAMWKKTRKFANTTHRWEESGKWVDFQSSMDILFTPKYWKERF